MNYLAIAEDFKAINIIDIMLESSDKEEKDYATNFDAIYFISAVDIDDINKDNFGDSYCCVCGEGELDGNYLSLMYREDLFEFAVCTDCELEFKEFVEDNYKLIRSLMFYVANYEEDDEDDNLHMFSDN